MGIIVICLLYACDTEYSDQIGNDRRLSSQELATLPYKNSAPAAAYYFGFDLRAAPKEDARQYLPFLAYLHRKTGYTFKLRFTPKDGEIVRDIGTGVVQFAAIGAVSYIQANQKYRVIPLVRGLNQAGKDRYRSFFVIRPTSSLAQVKQIIGTRFAFGSRASTQGHLIPRIIFHKQGIGLADLKTYKFTGSHINCLNSVLLNESDVCGMQDVMAGEFARQGKVKILHRSNWYPSSGIVANSKVPDEVCRSVKAALLAFQPTGRDAKGLYNWNKTEMANGFVEAKDQDYAGLRQWMKSLALKEFN